MKRSKNKALILAVVGAVIGFMYSMLFDQMFSMLITVPVFASLGSVTGWLLDQRQKE